ncbi:hypothetical protein OS175_02525 [Marinicella sp. S1101]|uniref:hypothetical protein n=1 Tax=Marinicella marina TaxID=2996016 RepID=UPI002260AF25|nr:hypothetical protein [Marinicella marina]MCX7552742.1 hypothetical protein [Marinicella marina]MDJ1139949.1 hypothetical protein [Marinicella marina]
MIIKLSVAKVEFGGNTGEGQYFYAFSPQTIFITDKQSEFTIEFTASTAEDFAMLAVVSSDNNSTFTNPTFGSGHRSLSIKTNSEKSQLINVSVIVQDKSDKTLINCDPQVLNDPDLGQQVKPD